MNLEVKDLTAKITPLLLSLKKYVVLIFILVLAGIYGYLTYRINSLTQGEPDPNAIAEQLNTIPRSRVDQDAIDKMQQLEEENIEVQSLFDQARNNPFSE